MKRQFKIRRVLMAAILSLSCSLITSIAADVVGDPAGDADSARVETPQAPSDVIIPETGTQPTSSTSESEDADGDGSVQELVKQVLEMLDQVNLAAQTINDGSDPVGE